MASNGRLWVKYLRGREGVKKLTVEEGELSDWLYEIVRHKADELVVCNPVANKGYKKIKTGKLVLNLIQGWMRESYRISCVEVFSYPCIMMVQRGSFVETGFKPVSTQGIRI